MVKLIPIVRKHLSLSSSLNSWLIISSCFSVLLLLGRVLVTGSGSFLFLPWNLFLAYMPYYVSGQLLQKPEIITNKFKLLAALALWLLFVPNSFYILTDLFHLNSFSSAPEWFDLVLILSFAWNGVLFGIISLRRIEILMEILKGKTASLFLVFIVMCLNAFGIYIGRFLRFNSWDVITDPFTLIAEIMDIIFHPFQNFQAWSMTLIYSVFMTLLYCSIKKLAETWKQPYNNTKL